MYIPNNAFKFMDSCRFRSLKIYLSFGKILTSDSSMFSFSIWRTAWF